MRMQKRPDTEEVRRSRDFYDWWAPFYDAANRMAALVRGASDSKERRKAVARLKQAVGGRMLEVSCGTGSNLPLLCEAVGDTGMVAGLDISAGMLRRGRFKLRRKNDYAWLLMGDATRLPFHEGSFDAVFHHGGIAEFPNKRAAIAEMTRVVRPGGKVVICDAGLPMDRKSSLDQPATAEVAAGVRRATARQTATARCAEGAGELDSWRCVVHARVRESAGRTAAQRVNAGGSLRARLAAQGGSSYLRLCG